MPAPLASTCRWTLSPSVCAQVVGGVDGGSVDIGSKGDGKGSVRAPTTSSTPPHALRLPPTSRAALAVCAQVVGGVDGGGVDSGSKGDGKGSVRAPTSSTRRGRCATARHSQRRFPRRDQCCHLCYRLRHCARHHAAAALALPAPSLTEPPLATTLASVQPCAGLCYGWRGRRGRRGRCRRLRKRSLHHLTLHDARCCRWSHSCRHCRRCHTPPPPPSPSPFLAASLLPAPLPPVLSPPSLPEPPP